MIEIILFNKKVSISSRFGRVEGIRFNCEYRIGSFIFCLPLACGRQKISKKRLANYGKTGKIIKFLSGQFKVETKKGQYFLTDPCDCVPFDKD